MLYWRSFFFWGTLALVAVELGFVTAFYFQDGALNHTPSPAYSSSRSGAAAGPEAGPRAVPAPAHARSSALAPALFVTDASAFRFTGRWEHVTVKLAGRIHRKRSRAFTKGARAMFAFDGRFVRLYGTLGPGGGFGAVRVDGGRATIVDFFAPYRATHQLIYASPRLTAGKHRVSVVVIPDPKIASARTQYVNIDGAEYGT